MKLIFLNLELDEVDVEGFPSGSVVKNTPANAGDVGSIPESGGPLEEGVATHSYSCLESPIDKGAWWATVNQVTQSQA